MEKPIGYDTTEAKVPGLRIPKAGPCVLGIKSAHVDYSRRSNTEYLLLFLDIAAGPFKNFYREQSQRWGQRHYLRYFQSTGGNATGYFKGFVAAVESSNPGYTFQFDEQSLVGKLVGGNLRDAEYRRKDGTVGMALRVAYLCSTLSIQAGEHRVLAPKRLADEDGDYSTSVGSAAVATPHY